MSDDGSWFAPKRYGMGPGAPISWQGWALTVAYVLIAIVLVVGLKDRPQQMISALILPTAVFLVVSCRTTRGGCHWRWGEEE
ncbi:MAG TPA: hypothetical protein VGM04_00645 [Sphingomicrobium sp.]